MGMDGCGNCMKYTFGFVNLVILIFGGVLLGVGIHALVSDDYSQMSNLISVNLYTGTAILIVVAGGLIALISFLGCCGAFQESKCLLGTFFCLVLILFILTGAGAIVGFVVGSDKVLDDIGHEMNKTLDKYSSDDDVRNAWDFVQKDFQCCGVDGYSDWGSTSSIPKSCCKDPSCPAATPGVIYSDGCVSKVKDFFHDNSKLFGGIAIGVVIFLLLAMIISCAIMKSIR